MNILDTVQFERLHNSIKWSQQQLNFPRKKRVEAIKEFMGHHHIQAGAPKLVPVNMLKLSVDIYVRQLIARCPRALITTRQSNLKATAANLELAINQIPEEIELGNTLHRLVVEALFSMGIMKVGLHTVDRVEDFDYGTPFVDLVTIDDYFCDMSVKSFGEVLYEGNDYWIDYEEAMESSWIDKKVRAGLKPDEFTVLGHEGEERAEGLQQDSNAALYREKLWVRDVWLEKERLLVTYGVKSEKRFRIVEWEGPKHSPYYKLGFSDVPGNLLPLAPVSVWRDLHDLANALFRKLANQGDDQKTVLGFPGGNDDGVQNFKAAKDGDGITYTGAEPKTLTAGGVDQKTLAFFLQTRDLASYFAGNLDSLGGLAPLTETVGQDKLLSEAAGAQLRDMTDNVVGITKDIFQALAWYEWHDPISSRTLEKPIPGAGITIPVEWNSESRQGDFDLYDLKIDVFSAQDNSPGIQLQKLGMVMQQYVLPLAPMIEAAGGIIDAQKIIETVAKYSDLPELNEIVMFVQPGIEQKGKKAGMPAHTTREYVHSGRPGITRQGASTTLQQSLLGGKLQGSQEQQLADRGVA